MILIIIALIIALIVIFYLTKYLPTDKASFGVNKNELCSQIIKHQELFDGQNYSTLKSHIPNLDAAIYSDVKSLRLKKIPLSPTTLSVIF